MEYRKDASIDQSRVRYSGRGGPTGRRVALGGGLGGLVIVVLVVLFGSNFGITLDDIMREESVVEPVSTDAPECQTAADIDTDRDCRWAAYDVALESYWSGAFSSGFRPVSAMQLFSGQIPTACGTGASEMGPFYCPGDETIYLDTEFMGYLFDKLGAAGGDAAELYVVAHEYGHHISHLTGQLEAAQTAGASGPDSAQVRLELQADCYAGVFFHNTAQDPDSPIAAISEDDLLRITDAARAVGDDHIQQQQTGTVQPESWTHGSSEMRQRWVSKGFESGDPNVCDTFGPGDI